MVIAEADHYVENLFVVPWNKHVLIIIIFSQLFLIQNAVGEKQLFKQIEKQFVWTERTVEKE